MARIRRARGYLLLESIVAGGILSVALATSVNIVAHYRLETTMAARLQEASSLAIAKADELVGTGLDTSVLPANQALTADPKHPGFRVGYALGPSGLHAQSTPPLPNANALIQITVTVEYPTSQGLKTVSVQRLKRDRG